MQPYSECPQVLRDFLSYHESIKGQSRRTVSEYHLDLRLDPYDRKQAHSASA